jgi:2-iminobutanoate/2-iminopropanoate deaminase
MVASHSPGREPTFLHSNNAAGVSRGVVTDHFAFASAVAIDVQTMKRLAQADTVENETRICLEQIENTFKEAGLTRRDVVKTTCYLRDEAYRMEFLAAYKAFFGDGPYPCRCTVVLGIAGDCRVQVEATAVLQ